jgi:glycosyltransferase involved in cell wall biosynthesis
MQKVLFIGHDASRTGAPTASLHLLRTLKKTYKINLCIVLKNGGVLENEYKNISNTYVWNSEDRNKILDLVKQEDFDLIFVNSCASCEVLIELKKYTKAKVIMRIPELEPTIRNTSCCGLETFRECKKLVDEYITPSEVTRQNLIENHNISNSKISTIYGCVPTIDYQKISLSTNIRQSLGLSEDDFIVVGCGTSDSRKGYDLFIQLAHFTNAISESAIYFIWVGSLMENSEKISYDINHLGLKKLVFFVGEKANVLDYMQSSDLFALTSREDPFPLVCLEASSFGKPVICFEKSGGMPELVSKIDSTLVIPHLDIEAFGKKIIQLKDNVSHRLELGNKFKEHVIVNHDISIMTRQIFDRLLNK